MTAELAHPHIGEVLLRQRQYFSAGNTRAFAMRDAHLASLEKSLKGHQGDILAALRADLHKPELEAFLAEYYFLLQEIRQVRKSLKKWLKPQKVASPVYFQPCQSKICREPYGVVLVVAPWNYPIQLALAPLISAIAAGNTVVLKPSEHATESEALLVKILAEVFPPELVHVQTGGVDVAAALLDEKFDFIFFTGSTEVGKIVAKKAAERLIPCVLELGGKCPCVVDGSADIPLAASRILAGKFFNGGQTCFAPDFVAVHASVKEAFLREIQSELERVPWHQEMAHVINQNHYQRLHELLQGLSPEQIIVSGEDDSESCKMAPRVIGSLDWSHVLLQQEVFGPLLPVVAYDTDEFLIEKLAGYGDPLAMYIFSEDEGFCETLQNAKRSGGVCINDTMKQSSHLGLPFGGVGESGYGRYRGKYGVWALSYQRAVVRRGKLGAKWMDIKPPYAKTFHWLQRFMR